MTALVDATIEQVDALGALTELVVEIERTISSLQAVRDGMLAVGARLALEVAEQAGHPDYGDLALRTVAAEFGAALRVSDRTVQRRMAAASFLVERFPLVWQAQGAGRITANHARVIVDAGEHLQNPADRDAYSTQLVEFAESESPNRVARLARRVAERFQPRPLDERHRDAREQRRVWVNDLTDGMAELGVLGPATLVHGAYDRLTQMAQVLQRADSGTVGNAVSEAAPSCPDAHTESVAVDAPDAGDADADADAQDPRTIDQTRCDLALDLLLTGAPTGHDTEGGMLTAITGEVSVTVPVLTLLGQDTTPAELDGTIPVDAVTAKTLAGAASGWDRVLTHPVTGAILTVDRYRPTADLKRHLTARDQRCRFPACGYPARNSDLDHTQDAALGGPTTDTNLGALCRRHHTLKHHTPWHVEHHHGGIYTWTSPTGRVYTDHPPPQNTVTFTEHAGIEPDSDPHPPPW
ncbi:DUF222 domain-containing protein [Microbacterium sp.]|uniref:HNH endonuclease signature motif containing protein n=1 Tax=Microbacterium sp. TaxID=51671 RepID=UPI0028113F09|nr:DUF222 domain-containing protein [Microbacterium sp.]